MQALVLSEPQGKLAVQSIPIPTPSEHKILIKVHSTALNPVDWKMIKYNVFIQNLPTILGCDVSGTVVSTGPGVTGFSAGDQVYAFTPLGEQHAGTFGEYTLVDARSTAKKPAHVTFDQAATLPCGVLTAALGLYHHLGLSTPTTPSTTADNVLVWGASSAVGAFVVQLARLSGYTVIGVCSARNFEYVKSLGAHHVVDYNSPNAKAEIQQIGTFKYAFDVIGDVSATVASEVITADGHLVSCATSHGYKPANGVKFEYVFIGTSYIEGGVQLVKLSEFSELVRGLLEANKLKPLVVRLLEGGLSAIPNGLELLEAGKVSAQKLVVNP